jgi:C_GCAxxG_C_C family probable redox protein
MILERKLNARQEQAVAAYKSGLNCAQSVVTTYAESLGFDHALAEEIAGGFGGGMGRLQRTCGAVTGAFMVLSINNAQKFPDPKERKEKTYEIIQAFDHRFIELNGTTQCRSLLGCDLNTEAGREYVKAKNLSVSVCERCIAHAVLIADDLMK